MSDVARATEISARSTVSFEDVINSGVASVGDAAERDLGGVKEQQVRVENGQVAEYQVNLLVTFVLE